MYARPTTKETEEDILLQQEEFLKKKANNEVIPAAKLSKESVDCKLENAQGNVIATNTQTQLENTFESIPSDIGIGRIIEKAPLGHNVSQLEFSHRRGFPQAKRRDPTVIGAKGSIFSQQMKRLKKDVTLEGINIQSTSKLVIKENQPMDVSFNLDENVNTVANIPQQSYIVTGSEKDAIHQQNIEILKQMGENEILEERNKLLSTMDPAIIAFLKAKRKDELQNRTASIAEQNKAAENIAIEEIESSKDIIMHPEAERWLNFDTVETGKLAWMTNIEVPKFEKEKSYEARFDFDGWLLPFAEPQINEKSRGLYHHGEEPGRPGYTLQELFQLSRSSINQQKIVALNTIANILSLYQSGIYEGIIEMPLEQIFFVLRFCLDDNVSAVLNASIKAIRNLFFCPIDETCLDNLLGFGLGMVQPIIAVDNNEIEDDNTINDQQLAETNLVKCLARTDILKRIRYIVNTVHPSMETIVYCLEILIRMARDSDFIVKQIFNCEGLLESILKNFVPAVFRLDNLESAYGCPLQQAIKLVRILCTRTKEISEKFVNRYKIMDSLTAYLSNESLSTNSNGLKLQIESLHLWCVIAHYGLGSSMFKNLEPILWRMLDFHVRNTNVQPTTSYVIQGHVAALLNLLTVAVKQNYNMSAFTSLLYDIALIKWTTQFSMLEEFTCGKLQIITSFMRYLSQLYQNKYPGVPLESIERNVIQMLNSKGFEIVTNNIKTGSNLLSHFETVKSGANLKSIEAASWKAHDHIIPTIHTSSSLTFLSIFSEFVVNCGNYQIKLNFLKHKNINKYLNQINKTQTYNLVNNWFTRLESQLIVNILKIAVIVQRDLDTAMFYEITVKCLSVFNSEQKEAIQFVLTNIVFSPQFYPCEILLNNLDISENNDLLRQALDNLDTIFNVYANVLNIKMKPSTNLCVEISKGNVMPVDWIYSPIILLYSNQQQNKSDILEEQQILIVTNCLRWIYIYEMYFPALAKLINPTDRFCRIACTFLGSDTLFLNSEVHKLLEACLKHILASNEKNINFSKPIQGLNNFQDFYTQLLEQYQGVSYGDTLFGNFILLPLIQRHDVKYRKILWSEYAGIIQIFNVTQEQVLCPIELFLNPAETDISLLKCYRKAVGTGAVRKHSIFYKIADHHVQAFINRRKVEEKQ